MSTETALQIVAIGTSILAGLALAGVLVLHVLDGRPDLFDVEDGEPYEPPLQRGDDGDRPGETRD